MPGFNLHTSYQSGPLTFSLLPGKDVWGLVIESGEPCHRRAGFHLTGLSRIDLESLIAAAQAALHPMESAGHPYQCFDASTASKLLGYKPAEEEIDAVAREVREEAESFPFGRAEGE